MFEKINSLKAEIYSLLTSDTNLMALINGVFDFVPQDKKYPYIFIGDFISKDISNIRKKGLEVNFSIRIFDNNSAGSRLISICDILKNIITPEAISISLTSVVALNIENFDFSKSSSEFGYSANLNLKAIIFEE
jgi:hypothetical protein